MKILTEKYTRPIEREFEGWIISRIEEYFHKINKQVRIFAVSPSLESTFPADEVLSFNYKILGLQFKRAYLSNLRVNQSNYDYSNVHWPLNNPVGQFALIQNMNEIYYCLPTFINRDYKSVSLDHCFFWRPNSGMVAGTYWYKNPRIDANKNIEKNSLRWGQFIERIYSCSIGNLTTTQLITRQLLFNTILGETEFETTVDGLYAFIIEI